ncbi:MAG: phenylalanine 4-monooxygenase [Gemmatirosa sp.]
MTAVPAPADPRHAIRPSPSPRPEVDVHAPTYGYAYTDEEHEVWATLYARRMVTLADTGSVAVLAGIEAVGLRPDRVPDLREVNARLARRTGWSAVPVGGFLPPKPFFASLAQRRFPTTTSVRPRAQLDYLPEPDVFHDVFGHVPLHADPTFAGCLQRFGVLGLLAESDAQVEQVARLFWFTVEFGLVRERGATRVYGSGLVSSHAEAANALGPRCERRPFALDAVLAQPYVIDRLQDVLFELTSFGQLWDAVRTMEARLGAA